MCPRAPSPDFGPKGCYVGPEENWEQRGFCPSSHLRLWEKITSQAARSQPGKPGPCSSPMAWMACSDPTCLEAADSLWDQLTVCGTSSQSSEDPAAEAVVVDKRPGVTWSTRGRHRGAGKGDWASQRASTPGPSQEGPPGPEASPVVLSPEGSWAATPSREWRGWTAVHPQTPALSLHPISCTTSSQVGKE